MKINELLTELVTRADDIGHFRNRIAMAAKLCTALGNRPLIFRAMTHDLINTKGGTLLAKVDHSDVKNPQNRKGGGGYRSQLMILQKLGIQHPTFTTMTPPYDAREFHGKSHIFIPLNDNPPWWSPRVQDLGGSRVIDDNGNVYRGEVPGKPNAHYVGWMEKEVDKWSSTYIHEWPKQYTTHEIIFDTDTYYLLEMESFLTKFAGKEFKNKIEKPTNRRELFKKIDPTVWDQVKTYNDVGQFLTTTAPAYLDWWEFELPKIKAEEERKSELYWKIRQEWEKGGGFDPDNAYDDMRRGSKIQNRKPGEQGVAEGESGLNQTAGIGINGKQFNFSIKDLIAKAKDYPVKKLDPQLFVKQLADRREDPKQTASRAQSADLQYPIIVVQDGDTFMIADGTHRAQKAIMNKLSSINARVIPIKDMAEFSKRNVAENFADRKRKK
jgi:hypothetical protein